MGEAPKKKRKMIDRDDALLDNSGGKNKYKLWNLLVQFFTAAI